MVLVCMTCHLTVLTNIIYNVMENILLVVQDSRMEVNPLKPSSYCVHHQVCYSFLKVCTHGVFCVDLGISGDYFSK
jgi:hypothetical protein